MLLFEASKEGLLKIMSKLKSNKSASSDGMLPKLAKHSCQELSTPQSPLLTIINRAIWQGIFPDKLKIAKVIHIFKKNEPFLPGNYRLLAVSVRFSKKIMYSRLYTFLRFFTNTSLALGNVIQQIWH